MREQILHVAHEIVCKFKGLEKVVDCAEGVVKAVGVFRTRVGEPLAVL